MKITVFGASKPKPGEQDYLAAYQLGKLLAELQHTVITGGYMGTMEAVSRGADEHGGHTIGITCREIENWRPTGANPWIRQEIKEDTLLNRIIALINTCDAAFALPGGTGTLTEISVMWNLMGISAIKPKPLILIGKEWESVFDHLFTQFDGYYPLEQRNFLYKANSNIDALKMLENYIQ